MYEGTFLPYFVTPTSVGCKIPSYDNVTEHVAWNSVIAMSYQISVSNDNATFSNEITFYNYNGACVSFAENKPQALKVKINKYD